MAFLALSRMKSRQATVDFRQVINALPVAVMTCDISTFRIDYANLASVTTLHAIRHVLKIDPEEIVGTSIDVFHARLGHQRAMLADPANLPHSTRITVGEEVLDLQIDALHDQSGCYTHAVLSWSVVTEKVAEERRVRRLMQMIDAMPINVMMADPENEFRIGYMNATSLATLRDVEKHLDVSADDVLGSSIDIFHKNPTHQRRMLADPDNLPHRANIRVGPEVLSLDVSAIVEGDHYIGPMLTWSVITDRITMAESVTEVVEHMSEAASEMDTSARAMLDCAEEGEQLASSVLGSAEELSTAIADISSRVSESSTRTTEVSREMSTADELAQQLGATAKEIGTVIQVIDTVAWQTNLLALNATIEATRAGDAGRGFAVVAEEVKNLAMQTTRATDDIRRQIGTVQTMTGSVVEAIGRARRNVASIDEIAAQIAAAVEEQSATTADVTRNIGGVTKASRDTGAAAKSARGLARSLSEFSGTLSDDVRTFVKTRG